jgi:hypothetical protein
MFRDVGCESIKQDLPRGSSNFEREWAFLVVEFEFSRLGLFTLGPGELVFGDLILLVPSISDMNVEA